MTSEAIGLLAKTVSESKADEILSNPDKVYFPFLGNDNIFTNGFKLDSVMFRIPGTNFQIYWYGFLIALGILLAMIYGFKKMRSFGIDPDRATDCVIGGLIGAVIGARLYYVIFSLDRYRTASGIDWKGIISIRDGGLAIYGGIIGALLVGCIIAKIKKLKIPALLDVAAPCFLIGQCIGRWGNFFNQEAFGSNTTLPWGMMSSKTISYLAGSADEIMDRTGIMIDYNMPVHPCFLYESLWCLLGFLLLHFYIKRRKFDGEIFLMYIGWYGLGRFFIEMLRTDSLYLANIKVSELVAGTCVLAAVILIIVFRSMVKRDEDYMLYCDTELSKAQLAEYVMYSDMKKEKSELKKKIRNAKAKGESFSEFLEEYERKFGKNAKPDKSEKSEEEELEYESMLSEEDVSELDRLYGSDNKEDDTEDENE